MRFHRHKRGKIVATRRIVLTWDGEPGDHKTEVLGQCVKCGEPMVETLDGYWTEAQVREADDSDGS